MGNSFRIYRATRQKVKKTLVPREEKPLEIIPDYETAKKLATLIGQAQGGLVIITDSVGRVRWVEDFL